MKRNEFMKKLEAYLAKVPEHDRKDMLYDFDEHFTVGIENGKTEEEVVEELGDPHLIAKDLIADYQMIRAEKGPSVPNTSRTVFATIGLSFFNLVFLLGPVIGLIGVYFSLCVTAFSFTVSPLLAVLWGIFTGFEDFMIQFFMSVTLCGIGILISIAIIHIGKFSYKIMLRYTKFNIKVMKGGKIS